MLSSSSDLEELRRRIDGIDNNLLELLVDRLKIVAQVAALKSDGTASYVPSREAAIIRRLVARTGDMLPVGSMVRMWRELLGAAVRSEGPFAVGTYVPPDGPGLWDVSRDHYGSQMPMTLYRTTLQVIRAVTDRRVAVGVLPMPRDDDSDPWWVHLLSPDADVPRVVARLPFGPRGNARSDGDALAIGYGPQQSSGDDRTLLATENAVDISQGRFAAAFAALGMTCRFIFSCGQGETTNTLIEIDGFVSLEDPRLAKLRERLGDDLLRLFAVGSYAVPLAEANGGAPASGLAQPASTAGNGIRG
ncbi:MAG TPA: chorismate mutase [Stellaceae bacterium]|nr:chorismate mutase [Stellaceae bacterium]